MSPWLPTALPPAPIFKEMLALPIPTFLGGAESKTRPCSFSSGGWGGWVSYQTPQQRVSGISVANVSPASQSTTSCSSETVRIALRMSSNPENNTETPPPDGQLPPHPPSSSRQRRQLLVNRAQGSQHKVQSKAEGVLESFPMKSCLLKVSSALLVSWWAFGQDLPWYLFRIPRHHTCTAYRRCIL